MQVQVNTIIGQILVEETNGNIIISLEMSKLNLNKVVVCAESAGTLYIGPDVEVNIGHAVDEICSLAETEARNS